MTSFKSHLEHLERWSIRRVNFLDLFSILVRISFSPPVYALQELCSQSYHNSTRKLGVGMCGRIHVVIYRRKDSRGRCCIDVSKDRRRVGFVPAWSGDVSSD